MINGTALQRLLGQPVTAVRALHGGDLSQVALVTLADGSRLVAKRGEAVAVEGRMLQAMEAAGAPAPRVLAARGDLLAIEYLPDGPPTPDAWVRLGAALRWLHGQTGPAYGWPEDYAFGDVHIPGTPPAHTGDTGTADTWPAFWAGARLRPCLPHVPFPIAQRLARLCDQLPERLPARPPAALLHGDLWQGNLHFGPRDRVHLIDPACAHGDAEVDLAMLHLFGRPGSAFSEAYGPLAPGWQDRRPIYQLWPALVHLRLFGGGYAHMVTGLLDACGV